MDAAEVSWSRLFVHFGWCVLLGLIGHVCAAFVIAGSLGFALFRLVGEDWSPVGDSSVCQDDCLREWRRKKGAAPQP